MNSFSLKEIGRSIIKSKSSTSPKKFLINEKQIKILSLNSSFKKENDNDNDCSNENQKVYPLTNRAYIKPKYFSPIKNNNNYKEIENYLLSASLLSKNKNSKNNFNIDYFKKISKKYSPLINKRTILSSVLAKNTKEAYKKNLLIDMLQKKREEILLNEKDIQYSFRLKKRQIDNNFHNFSLIKNEYKTIRRKEEKIMNYYILVNQKIKTRYINEEINNKRLKDTIEKTIRDIYKLKDYANFINKLYNMPFTMDKINDNLFYNNKFEILSEQIINLYNKEELEKENIKKEKILNDIQLFIKNYNSYEDKIIQLLKEKETIINDTYIIKNENKNKLKYLIKRKNNYENDENSIINIKKNFNKENMFETNEIDSFNDVLKAIIEIGNIIGINISKNPKEDTIPDYLKYCKDIFLNLRNLECLIDKYTKDIDNIINSKNKNEKIMIEKIILNRKKNNLTEKQNFIKKTQEKLNELNKIKTINKIKKKVVKGRIVIDYKNINLNKKKIKKKIVRKVNSDKELLYYLSEDDKI